MSPRKPAVLRDSDGPNLRDHLIATAARMIGERGSAGLAVRDIAREAQVADGVLYNYFEDKEDLLAHALLAHVGFVMNSMPRMLPPAGTGSVAENLSLFIERGFDTLGRVTPAFAGLLSQPKVLIRFHAMVGGDAAFGTPPADREDRGRPAGGSSGEPSGQGSGEPSGQGSGEPPGQGAGEPSGRAAAEMAAQDTSPEDAVNAADAGNGPRGLPDLLTAYLQAEQRLGRIDHAADIEAVSTLIVGVIHGQVLPRLLFSPPGTPLTSPPGLAARLAQTVLDGIAQPAT
jgi:AcrR family transcriptional regulator